MSYSIEEANDRVLIHGSLPIDVLTALQPLWEKRGLDTRALGVSSALGATLAVCRKGDVDKWIQEVAERATTLSNGDAELEWLLGADTGVSSKTIFSVLASTESLRKRCYTSLGWGADVPHDPDDFGRCHRLLETFPAWRTRLTEVAEAFPKWSPLVEAWDELTTLYLEELPTRRCPKLYDRMQELRA